MSTLVSPAQLDYEHYANVLVLAEYYQPEMIYLIANGVNKSLETNQWRPIMVNTVIEAYAARALISEGAFTIACSH